MFSTASSRLSSSPSSINSTKTSISSMEDLIASISLKSDFLLSKSFNILLASLLLSQKLGSKTFFSSSAISCFKDLGSKITPNRV